MRKNISDILQKGNLTPKERSLMVVHDAVAEDLEGKGFLSDADKYALVQGWQPKDDNEVKEYNKYNGVWRTVGYAELDAQTTFLNAQVAFLRANIATSYYLHTAYEKVLESKDRFFDWSNLDGEKRPNGSDILETVLENSGLARDYVAYRYAFELMDDELKQDMRKLYPDIETESDYLKAELELYELLGDKGEASQEAKQKVAELVAKRAFNEYASALIERKGDRETNNPSSLKAWSFGGYFADIPLLEVAKKLAEYNGIDYSPEVVTDESALAKVLADKIEAFAEQRDMSVGELVKRTVLRWLDEGLLDVHRPLFLSDEKETVNGEGTMLSHRDIFKRWLQVKTEASRKIQNLIDNGELKTRVIPDEVFGVKREREAILGKSLYQLKEGLKFVDDYKRQVEALMPVGFLFDIIKRGGLVDEYATLLGFQDILTRLSKIYEIDLTYKVAGYLAILQKNIDLLNGMLGIIKEKYGCEAYMLYDCLYFMDVPQTSFVIDVDTIEIKKDRLGVYYKELEKALGAEFEPKASRPSFTRLIK